jgi:hypothetical protein
MARNVTRTSPSAPIDQATQDTAVSVLSGIENDAKGTHDSDQRLLEQSRVRLEIHRTNLQRALRLIDGQIEAYDRMIHIARSRAKEL